MKFKVKIHPKVDKFLSKSPNHLSDRIKRKFLLLKQDPFRYLEHYEGEKCYKLRIGDYRALIDVSIPSKIVYVRVLEHRSNIYKR